MGEPLSAHYEAYCEDLLDRKEEIEWKLQGNINGQDRVRLLKLLETLNGILNEQEGSVTIQTQDPLSAYWDEQIALGEEPNLELTLADLRKMGRI